MKIDITEGPVDALTYVIEPHGEIDIGTATNLNARLLDAVEAGRRFVIVDLGDVQFVDSSGLGVLLSTQRRLQTANGRLVTVCSDPLVRRIFEIAGLIEVLSVVETRRDAIAYARQFADTA